MDSKNSLSNPRNRFLKLSLKKNRKKACPATPEPKSSPDIIVLDESFDRLCMDWPKKVQLSPKIYSPITINDSCDQTYEDIMRELNVSGKTPGKAGNVSLNLTKENIISPTETKDTRPSIGGWSPAQSIICATPRQETVPSTPKDIANESLEQCSIKKIEQSHKKLLSDLYGEKWKTIPTLFKSISAKYDNLSEVSKKLKFNDDDESDKENIRHDLRKNRELYLTGSERKLIERNDICDSDRKSKKKLYTEKIPNTPEPKPIKVKGNSTTKKNKGKTITELVNERINKLTTEVDLLTNKVKSVSVTPTTDVVVKRLSFLASLADNVPSWRCHIEAIQYRDNYKTLREQLSRRLFKEFNKGVFSDRLDADMAILWDTKLRSTAGTTTNRLIKNAKCDRIRTSYIKLSTKVLDAPQRLRDTLIHELCHAATWLIDGELRAGHGPLWKKWATRAIKVFPELGEISRCHDMEIHFKYSYKCTKCGYSIKRHSKSIDITKKCCGYCRGTFEIIVNKKTKDGVVVSTPARKGGPNDFALYVKENYGTLKDGTRTHAQVMKLLGEQFAAKKTALKNGDVIEL
ncbi:uncharacterized protein [Epargyreus clarus]|uniref:uncharacterized protein n=1 Tax=Epargyreus clarus TaxID=520877 RepID=UPI003C2FAA99